MAKNFPKPGKEIDICIQEAQKVEKLKRPISRHIYRYTIYNDINCDIKNIIVEDRECKK